MDVEDNTRDGSASSIILESLQSTQQGDKLSDDDLAWVNSCLVTDTEILESNWTSFKDVLLEIIGDQPKSLDSSANGRNDFLGGTEITMLPSVGNGKAANYSGRTDDDLVIPVNRDNETNANNIPIKKWIGTQLQLLQEDSPETFRGDDLVIPVNRDNETNTNNIPIKKWIGTQLQLLQEDSPETFQGDPFLPTYKEGERTNHAVDLGVQLSLSAEEMNSSAADIFRLWDLDIPDEEGDLVKELNKVVAETTTPFQSTPLAFDESTAWKGLDDELVDNLIAGIQDLSLNTNMF